MSDFQSSDIRVRKGQPRIVNPANSSSSVFAMLVLAEKGPLDQPVSVTSLAEYEATFGGPVSGSYGWLEAKVFFDGGGRQLWVVRVASSAAAKATAVVGTNISVTAKTEGTDGNKITATVKDVTASTFTLEIKRSGTVVETFTGLTADSAVLKYAETYVSAESAYVDLAFVGGTDVLPVAATDVALVGGDNGISGIAATDFEGAIVDASGLYALDSVLDVDVIFAPDAAGLTGWNEVLATYCHTHRDEEVFGIVEFGADDDETDIAAEMTAAGNALLNLTEAGGAYAPWLFIRNPARSVYAGTNILIPASGLVAAAIARLGTSRGGVYKAPAGVEDGRCVGAVALADKRFLTKAVRDALYAVRVNPITAFPGTMIHIDGSRTLKGDGNFPSVPESRGVMKIMRDVKAILLPYKHKPNTASTRSRVEMSLRAYLTAQMYDGAFVTNDPDTAFYVDVSDAINPPSVARSGKMIVRLGLATANPAEFFDVEIAQDTRAIEEELNQ